MKNSKWNNFGLYLKQNRRRCGVWLESNKFLSLYKLDDQVSCCQCTNTPLTLLTAHTKRNAEVKAEYTYVYKTAHKQMRTQVDGWAGGLADREGWTERWTDRLTHGQTVQ